MCKISCKTIFTHSKLSCVCCVHVTWISDLLVVRVQPLIRYSPYRESTPCDMHVPAKTLCAHKDTRPTDTDTIPCIVLTSYITCLDWNKFRNGKPENQTTIFFPRPPSTFLTNCASVMHCTVLLRGLEDARHKLWGQMLGPCYEETIMASGTKWATEF